MCRCGVTEGEQLEGSYVGSMALASIQYTAQGQLKCTRDEVCASGRARERSWIGAGKRCGSRLEVRAGRGATEKIRPAPSRHPHPARRAAGA